MLRARLTLMTSCKGAAVLAVLAAAFLPHSAAAQSCVGVGVVDPTSGNAIVDPVNGSISCVELPTGGTVTLGGQVNESTNLGSLNLTTSYTYDTGTDLLTLDSNGTVMTTTHYDSLDRLTSSSPDNLGGTTAYTYSGSSGEPTQVDRDGAITQYDYNGQGRVIDTRDSMGDITTLYQYDSLGQLVKVTDAAGDPLFKYTYDSSGRLSMVENETTGDITTYTYDTLIPDQVDSDSDVSSLDLFGTTTYTYDAVDRMTSITDPNGVTTTTYDALDRVISSVDASNGPDYVYSDSIPEPGSVVLLSGGLGLMGLLWDRGRALRRS